MPTTTRAASASDFPTVEIPVIEGAVVEDFPTAAIPLLPLLPPVPQSARVAARLPLSARVARRGRMLRASAFAADLYERRGLIAACALVLIAALVIAVVTRGTYWTGAEWAPIPVGGAR